jgi:hypothetical protein
MDVSNLRSIPWEIYGETVLNPIAFTLTIVMCFAILVVKREYIAVTFILIACFITNMQRIVIFGLDFPMLRIMTIFGFIRIFIKKDIRSFKFNIIDKLIIWWLILRCITHTLLWTSSGAFINTLGFIWDSLGPYLIMRIALYDIEDYHIISKVLAVCSVIIAIFMFYEQITGRNFFSVLGGVPEETLVREGKLRSQGAFSHAIMAGTFGALLIPLMWILWLNKNKFYAFLGFCSGIIITITSSSSGPVLTLFACFAGLIFWPLRNYIKRVKQGAILMLIALHLVMKGPVWSLLGRIDISGGSTGYHRANLIDASVNHFTEWVFFGAKYPGSWGWGLQDLTNMFVYEAVEGGIIPLILFIMIIRYSFKTIGSTMVAANDNLLYQKYIWALGTILFANIISFIGVSYFGQMIFFYFLQIAMISSLDNFPSIINSVKSESC